MRRYSNKKIAQTLYKTAQGIVISVIMAGVIFVSSSQSALNQLAVYETIPNSKSGKETMFFKLLDEANLNVNTDSEPDDTSIPDVKESVSEALATEETKVAEEKLIIGINDIVFQDEEEFGSLPDGSYKENFTTKNIDRLSDRDYFINNFYNKDANTGVIKSLFDPEKFLRTNSKINKTVSSGPQVLIFHTHGGTEYFIDSDTSDISEGIVGAGERLKYILENKYGISALHHKGIYDMVNGASNRDGSYERMEPDITRILAENPSIEVVIDLHRDGIEPNPNLVTHIDGKPYAKIMFVNGLSAIDNGDEIKTLHYLNNEYLEENLAFSFNMQIAANELYQNFSRKILLKPYRFSTHMKARSLLVEVGSQYNTKEEVFNSMELLADLIETVVFK